MHSVITLFERWLFAMRRVLPGLDKSHSRRRQNFLYALYLAWFRPWIESAVKK
jgi:hypothetical protein